MFNMNNSNAAPESRSFLRRKYWLSILAGIIALLVLGAARQLNGQDMRTYTSTDGRFKIRFPSNFTLHVNEVSVAGSDVFHPVSNIVELDVPGHPRPSILIEYMFNVQPQSMSDFIENSSECDEITGQPGEQVVVSGMQGRVFRNINCNSSGETRIYLLNGDTGYIILLQGKPVDGQLLGLVLANFAPLSAKP